MPILVMGLAAMFAGIATGLVGLSAAAVMVPVMTTLLGIDPYIAVGIALASDVLASAFSAHTYYKYGNIDIKNAIYMSASVLVFTLLASYISSNTDNSQMGGVTNILAIFLGIKFFFKKEKPEEDKKQIKHKNLVAILFGCLIGSICGYIGAGGGVMLLLVLTRFLQYDTKKAVGTSVFIMALTALTGSVSHIALGGTDYTLLAISIVCATVGAIFAARLANRLKPETNNKVVGVFMAVFGITLTGINIFS